MCSPSASDTASCTVFTGQTPEMSTGSQAGVAIRIIRAGPHHGLRTVGGLGGVLDELAAAVDPHRVVGVRLVGLQQGELRVVAEVDTLVAEGPAQFEHPLHAADAQPLQVQLRGDAQEQVHVVGVDVRDEWPGGGSAVDLLQDRGLDLDESLGEQRLPDRTQHAAARRDQTRVTRD